ncbi:GNAT family N-acetyltransferase, partial [Streptomyces sp. SID5910]|nr:GNAT family N-acetyltransferase [Streptomyces sp. SID5910]
MSRDMSEVTAAIARSVEHHLGTPGLMLLASMAALLATAGFHTWWVRRHGHAPPAEDTGARPPSTGPRSVPAARSAAETGPD